MSERKSGIRGTLLSTKEAANFLGVSPQTVKILVERKKLPYTQLGKRRLFREESLEQWLINQETCITEEEQKSSTC